SPDRMLAGSEGILGVITEAWMRVQPRPTYRRSAGVSFTDFAIGAECVRELSQSGLHPANCRLIDQREAKMTMAGDGGSALLVIGFESADHSVDAAMERALEICREHGGEAKERGGSGGSSGARAAGSRGGGGDGGGDARRTGDGASSPGGGGARGDGGPDAVNTWRETFLAAPYLRDVFVAMGVICESFETAITWERFPALHERVMAAAGQAMREVGARPGGVSCRFTHVYPDGPAPYFTVLAEGRRGEELEQWAAIKRAVSEAILASGGTITHHHAVGRDHRPWYDRQRPEPFAAALRGAKRAVDPRGIMNPGVLVDPLR
ncbi:MAG: FAD-linked oxidase C-terminal domain-containing protein, partial [Solirubrobacteraceae bacterium]